MLVIVGMHFLGLICAAALLIPALRSSDHPPRPEGSDDGWGNQPSPPTPPPSDKPGPGVPLPDALPARVRLRDHERLGDLVPRPERRPAREPSRQPVPARTER